MKPSQNSLFKAETYVRSVAKSGILGLVHAKCYEIGQFHNKPMTQSDDIYDYYLRSRQGKRLLVPPDDVSDVYQRQRKRQVKVEMTSPTKLTCRYCGTPFLSLSDGRGRYPEYCSNACKQKAYRERKKASA